MPRRVTFVEVLSPMNHDAASATPYVKRHRGLDRATPGGSGLPERSGAPMAEHGLGTARKHGRHPPPMLRKPRTPHRIDTGQNPMQSARCETASDRVRSNAVRKQLISRYHAVLTADELPQGR
jgi:hypothetical protein